MITEDKITEIFCIVDDFCKFYDALMAKYTFKALKKRNYHRAGRMSKSEVHADLPEHRHALPPPHDCSQPQ